MSEPTDTLPTTTEPTPLPDTERRRWRIGGAILTGLAVIGGLLLVPAVWYGAQLIDPERERTSQGYDRSPGLVALESNTGSFDVVGTDRDGVRLERELTWSSDRPEAAEWWSGDTLQVRSGCPDTVFVWGGYCRVAHDADVPADTPVIAETTTGKIEVVGVSGDVTATSTTGSQSFSELAGDLDARASTGKVAGRDLRAPRTDVDTTTGAVSLGYAAAPDQVTVEATTGSVLVEVPHTGQPYRVLTDSSTGSQDVEVATDPDAERTIDLTTTTGKIAVRYAP